LGHRLLGDRRLGHRYTPISRASIFTAEPGMLSRLPLFPKQGQMSGPLRPGRPARGSVSGRPIMALLDLLGRRWALRVIWELREEPLVFRALQQRCAGM